MISIVPAPTITTSAAVHSLQAKHTHRKAFDRGAIGLDDDRHILVSQHVRSGPGSIELLVRFSGQFLKGPQPGCTPPAPPNIEWHRREVLLS